MTVIDFKKFALESTINEQPVEYTTSQLKMIDELHCFLNDPNSNVFLLQGYAGTGKTFMLAMLYRFMKKYPETFANFLCAPTGKASQVLNGKIQANSAKTIHRTIYDVSLIPKLRKLANGDESVLEEISESEIDDLEEFIDENKNIHVPIKKLVDLMKSINVFIFDEASMISSEMSQMQDIVFGSGILLDDIFTCIKKNTQSYEECYGIDISENKPAICKIIFCGDPAQLFPVGMTYSPALSVAHMQKKYGVNIRSSVLTDICRQNKDSTIIQNAVMLRDKINMMDYSPLSLIIGNEVASLSAELSYFPLTEKTDNFIGEYFKVTNPIEDHNAQIICYTNKDTLKFNRVIRNYIWHERDSEIRPGDRLLSVQNKIIQDEHMIYNGEFAKVEKVFGVYEFTLQVPAIPQKIAKEKEKIYKEEAGKNTDFVTFYYKEHSNIQMAKVHIVLLSLECSKTDSAGNTIVFNATVTKNQLYGDKPDMLMVEHLAIQKFRYMNNSKMMYWASNFETLTSNDKQDFMILKSLDCLLGAKYGYAITGHKSQGSEWDHVFVYCDNVTCCKDPENMLHWFYTAVTRASKFLKLINYTAPRARNFHQFTQKMQPQQDTIKQIPSNLKKIMDNISGYCFVVNAKCIFEDAIDNKLKVRFTRNEYDKDVNEEKNHYCVVEIILNTESQIVESRVLETTSISLEGDVDSVLKAIIDI